MMHEGKVDRGEPMAKLLRGRQPKVLEHNDQAARYVVGAVAKLSVWNVLERVLNDAHVV
jgi:hypothetical protein